VIYFPERSEDSPTGGPGTSVDLGMVDAALEFAFPADLQTSGTAVLLVFATWREAKECAYYVLPHRGAVLVADRSIARGESTAGFEFAIDMNRAIVSVGRASYLLLTEEGNVNAAQMAAAFPGPKFVNPTVSWGAVGGPA
jgi:hypothetical protein